MDELKVDRRFLEAILRSAASRTIVTSVVRLGNSLGITTVAEGVETEEQAALMSQMGCALAQGWHFGRPAPARDIPRMVDEADAFSLVRAGDWLPCTAERPAA